MKTIRKDQVEDPNVLRNEIDLLRAVKHPHIIDLVDVYEDWETIHIVTELCTGGELYDRVLEKAESEEKHFGEEDAARIIRDILDAIAYCHDVVKIVHRDLKPENFLLKDESENADVKIIDFGLSKRGMNVMVSRVGTPYYVAPEVLTQNYTSKCDVWSIGVISYILLCGFPPFDGDSDFEVIKAVETAHVDFPSPEWDDVSDSAKEFITLLLQRDPDRRPTASEALKHEWILNNAQPIVAPAPEERPSLERNQSSVLRMNGAKRNAFHKFLTTVKVKKTLGTIKEVLTPAEAGMLGEIFRKVDTGNDGFIDVAELDKAVESSEY